MKLINGNLMNGMDAGILKVKIMEEDIFFPTLSCIKCNGIHQAIIPKEAFQKTVPSKNGFEMYFECDCGSGLTLKITAKEYADILCKIL